MGQWMSNAGNAFTADEFIVDVGIHCKIPGRPDNRRRSGRNNKNDARTAFCQHRQVTRELNSVPKSLVRSDKDGLAFNGSIPEPQRLQEFG